MTQSATVSGKTVITIQPTEKTMRNFACICACFTFITFITLSSITLCQWENAMRNTIEQHENTIDTLTTLVGLQEGDYNILDENQRKLLEQLVGLKALNEAQEGRIQKMAGVFRIHEMNLLKEIERLKEHVHILDAVQPIIQLPSVEVDENGELIRPKKSPGFTEPNNGRHNQTETRPGVAHPETPCAVSSGPWMGCRSDAWKCFPTRHPRSLSLPSKMGCSLGRR
jgi:hypothetical protein